MKKAVAVAMIVKNEEAMLSECLETVKEADEIVICDTGSTDSTIEVAKRYTDKVYTDFEWCDHFARARNHVKSKVKSDWILSIDADELLMSPFHNVREAAERAYLAADCRVFSSNERQYNVFPRLFKNSPQVWWERAAHNILNVTGEFVADIHIKYRFSPAHEKDPDRTLRILEKVAADHLEATPVRELYYLGREYCYKGRHADAIPVLKRYVELSRYPAEKAEAFLTMARAYVAIGKPDEARTEVANALLVNANFKEAAVFMAQLAGEGSGHPKWEANAAQWRRMADAADNSDVLFVREIQKPRMPYKIDPSKISCCLITKDAEYPKVILDEIEKIGFGEVLIKTNCDSPHRKQELFEKANCEFLYYQDDDCIAPICQLLENADPDNIVCAMKPGHIRQYANSRIALIGWGSIFPKHVIKVLDRYRAEWGEDFLYRRETERIMTSLFYPQIRLALPITDLPSAMAPDRLSMQPGHYDYIPIVEQRCAMLLKNAEDTKVQSAR